VTKMSTKFIWSYFKSQEETFPDLKTQDICRLMFLSTYIDYSTNELTVNGSPMLFKDINKVMELDWNTYNRWINKMIQHNYIELKDNKVYINNSFFNKGNLVKAENIKAVRLFIDMTRDLYHRLYPKEHYKLGLLLQLVPYINPNFNCLAKNQTTTVRCELQMIKLSELAIELGYSERHCQRLGNEILRTRLGGEKLAVGIALNSLRPEDHIFMINTKLIFGGAVADYNLINELFQLEVANDNN